MGSQWMKSQGFGKAISTTVPSLLVSSFVQVTNQPFVRTSVMLQNPGEPLAKETFPNFAMLRHLAKTKGLGSLWLGTNAGILKTAPKYMVAIWIKDGMGAYLAPVDKNDKSGQLMRP